MPADYTIDTERRVIFSRASGVVCAADMQKHQMRLLVDPAFDRRFDQLWDLSEVIDVHVERHDVARLARSRSFEADARRAVVAPTDVTFGMARMFQTLHEDAPEEMRIFRSLGDARRWLGLDGEG